jgi:hypothetical protein
MPPSPGKGTPADFIWGKKNMKGNNKKENKCGRKNERGKITRGKI